MLTSSRFPLPTHGFTFCSSFLLPVTENTLFFVIIASLCVYFFTLPNFFVLNDIFCVPLIVHDQDCCVLITFSFAIAVINILHRLAVTELDYAVTESVSIQLKAARAKLCIRKSFV